MLALLLRFLLLNNFLVSIIIEVFDFGDYSDEEAACVLVVGEHSEALGEFLPEFEVVEGREHSVLDAPLLDVLGSDIFEAEELLEDLRPQTVDHDLPVLEALPELEPGQCDLLEAETALELFEGGGHDGLVLDGVQRAGRVGEPPAYLQKLQSFEQDARLKHVQGCPVGGAPVRPLLRDLTDGRVRGTGHVAHDTVEKETRVALRGRVARLVVELREVLSVVI